MTDIQAGYLERNNFVEGDRLEVDVFSSTQKLTRQGLILRNESDHAIEATLAGCSFVKTYKGGYWTVVKVDEPNDTIDVVLKPYEYVVATLTNKDSKVPSYYPGMPKFSEGNFALCDR